MKKLFIKNKYKHCPQCQSTHIIRRLEPYKGCYWYCKDCCCFW